MYNPIAKKLRSLGVVQNLQPDNKPGNAEPKGLGELRQVFDSIRFPFKIGGGKDLPSARELADVWMLNVQRAEKLLRAAERSSTHPFIDKYLCLQFIERTEAELSNTPQAVLEVLRPDENRKRLCMAGELICKEAEFKFELKEIFGSERTKILSDPTSLDTNLRTYSKIKLNRKDWYSAADLYIHLLLDAPITPAPPVKVNVKTGYQYLPTPVANMIEFVDFVKDSPPRSIIDIGSGRGVQALTLSLLLPGSKVTGIEIEPQLVKDSQLLLCRNAKYVDSEKISFVDGDATYFDYKNADWLLLFTPFKGTAEEEFVHTLKNLRQVRGQPLPKIASLWMATEDLLQRKQFASVCGGDEVDRRKYCFFEIEPLR